MENKLIPIDSAEFGKIRIVLIDGEPWLVGKDVATALGYTNPRKAIRDHVDDEDKQGERIVPHGSPATLINESGMYALIFGSKLDSAKKFKRWITSEVLPAIRKTGSYSIHATEPRWIETRTNTKISHKPFTAAIKILIGYLRQFGNTNDDGCFYGHSTNLIQNACGILKGGRDSASVAQLNKCDQCQNMIANVILNFVAAKKGTTIEEVDAAIILHLTQLNSLLSGQLLLK